MAYKSYAIISNIVKIIAWILFLFIMTHIFFRTEQSAETPEKTIDKNAKTSNSNNDTMKFKYINPPSYETLGRGLVYNCKGKHWACVNKDAYFTCRDNMQWNIIHKTAHECIIANVYATEQDCKLIQLHNINTREKTDFCK